MGRILDLLSLSLLSSVALAIGQNATIAFEAGEDSLRLASRGAAAQVYIDGSDWPGVIRAGDDLAGDFGRVTGTNGSLVVSGGANSTRLTDVTLLHATAGGNGSWSGGASGGVVIAGTIGRSAVIDSLIESGKLDVSSIEGEWEAFTSTVVESPVAGVAEALVIAGADRRGTIYGLYDVSEQIGVSPWYWFADSPSVQREEVYALRTTKNQASPSVRYRGIFINDEAPALTGWMNERYEKSQWGSAFKSDYYKRVFELLLRLRANYLWPAMWGSMFNVDDPKNQPLAELFGIVMGSSHTEPMMRATQEQNNFNPGPWQWNQNNASMYKFMKDGAIRAQGRESLFTVGARGNHDTELNGEDAVEQLTNIIAAQKEIITDVYGAPDAVPQMWCLYKEVQGYYEYDGLNAPEDVTLLWVDDNFGNIRRLPVGNETSRPGGAGVYHHFDYVGDIRNYKWINTIQTERTWEQMKLAYDRQARQIWIVNVGDLKPLEIPISHFLDMAYDISLFQEPESSQWWHEQYAAREFGADTAQETADILDKYSMLAARRKYELMDQTIYSVINYGEADAVLKEWTDLSAQAQAVSDSLPENARAAFFETVLHPVLAGTTLYQVHIESARNQLYAFQGRTSANSVAGQVLESWETDRDLTEEYNSLLDGKWSHMMDQTHYYMAYWQGPMRDLSPPLYYTQPRARGLAGDIGFSPEGQNGTVPGDDKYHGNGGANIVFPLSLNPYGPAQTYIDVFSTGVQSATWELKAPSYIKFSQSTGEVSPTGNNTDSRVFITVDWANAPQGGTVVRINGTSSTDYGTQYPAPYFNLQINNTALPSSFTSGFVESDRVVSIEAEHYSRITGATEDLDYYTIPNFGKTLSGVALNDNNAPSQTSTGPHLEYDFYAFSNLSRNVTVSVILGQNLNTDPKRPLKYAVAIDDAAPQVVGYVVDNLRGEGVPAGWGQAIANAGWNSTTNHTFASGAHTLKFWALEPGVILQKAIVNFGGVRKSYLGPPESLQLGARNNGTTNGTTYGSWRI